MYTGKPPKLVEKNDMLVFASVILGRKTAFILLTFPDIPGNSCTMKPG